MRKTPRSEDHGASRLESEVSFDPEQDPGADGLVERTINDCVAAGFIEDPGHVAASEILTLSHAYPRQTNTRKQDVEVIMDYLSDFDIKSFGRMAEWEYYNMCDIIPRARDVAKEIDTAPLRHAAMKVSA